MGVLTLNIDRDALNEDVLVECMIDSVKIIDKFSVENIMTDEAIFIMVKNLLIERGYNID